MVYEYFKKGHEPEEYVVTKELQKHFSDFFARFNVEFLQKFGDIKRFFPEYVTIDGEGCRFTEKGMLVSNYVLSDII